MTPADVRPPCFPRQLLMMISDSSESDSPDLMRLVQPHKPYDAL